MRKNIFLLLSLCLVIFSCEKDDESSLPLMSLDQEEVNFSNKTGTVTIPFESNVNWTAEWSESWLNVYPSKGDGSTKSFSVTLDDNETYDDRSSTITITGGGMSKTFTVNQDGSLGLLVSEEDKTHKLSNDASTIEVEVKANVELDVTVSDEWITQVETRGLSSTILKFDVAKNESHDNREGTITIKQENGSLESIITVYQSQEDAIILSEKTIDLSSDSETLEIELQTNVDFEVIIPEDAKSWVSLTPATRALREETLMLDVEANLSFEDRTTEIYVKNTATSLQETLTINQSGIVGISVSQNEFDLTYKATTIDVDVISKMDFDVTISDDWITQITTRADATATALKFDIAKNGPLADRVGTITLTQKGGELSTTITVNQSLEGVIKLSETVVDLTNAEQTLEVEFETNVDFEVIITGDAKSWVSVAPTTRALTTETLFLDIAENKTYEDRTALIYIKDKESDLQEIFTINQANQLVVVTVDAMGTLNSILSATEKETIQGIKLKGVMNAKDFEVLKKGMPNLTYVDLKNVTVENNEIPFQAFGEWNNPNEKITNIILPDNLTSIGLGAFKKCTGLIGPLVIPNGVTTIEDQAFFNCTSLKGTLIIPSGLTSIGFQALWSCRALDAIRFTSTTPMPFGEKMLPSSPGGASPRIEVPKSAVDSYKNAPDWSDFSNIIVGY